jgi:hypothetical protein
MALPHIGQYSKAEAIFPYWVGIVLDLLINALIRLERGELPLL